MPSNNNDENEDIFDNIEKLPLQSKKFIAYLISEIGWKLALFYVLWKIKDTIQPTELTLLVTIVITSGFIQIGYILGQAALDKYVQISKNSKDDDKTK